MKNPGVLLDAIVSQLRLVPGLVSEMGGDSSRISAYYDSHPRSISVNRAILDMRTPEILVIYDGFAPGNASGREVWKHSFRIIYRPGERELDTDTGETHYTGLDLLVDGVPAGSSLKLLDMEFDSSCESMDVPRSERMSWTITQDGAQQDYWVIRLALTEKGDD